MTPDKVALIEEKLAEKWSPGQISGWLREEQGKLISHETIYRHIWSDQKSGGLLFTHLQRQGKVYQSRKHSQA